MFVGHYGASLAGKAIDTKIPLWLLFLASQLADVLWAVFVFLGIERVNIVEGFTNANDLDLEYIPYSHSLTATIGWAVIAAGVYAVVSKKRWGASTGPCTCRTCRCTATSSSRGSGCGASRSG
jgi:hypothetical protein